MQYWTVWYPKAASTGLLVGRGLIDPTDKLLLHSAPPVVTVEVTDESGKRLAYGKDLEKSADSPMCLLVRDGDSITRQDLWPTEDHNGMVVLLPGGEAALLQSWWNAEDKKSWRWSVEFYNEIE